MFTPHSAIWKYSTVFTFDPSSHTKFYISYSYMHFVTFLGVINTDGCINTPLILDISSNIH